MHRPAGAQRREVGRKDFLPPIFFLREKDPPLAQLLWTGYPEARESREILKVFLPPRYA
jgi:hypothetical protein